MRIEEIWYGSDIRSKLGRIALFPLSLLYTAGWQTYLFIYKIGIKKAEKPHTPIICIGNFSSGGNGKTPTVAWIAKELTKRGQGVVISCSGYGSPKSEAATIAPSGTLSPSEWGDEPAEFRLMLPEIPIIVGRRRVLAAKLCADNFPDSILLMDDGIQHLPLLKDVSIALDTKNPTNSLCFPAGPYREPRNSNRATLVLPSHEYTLNYSQLEFKDAKNNESCTPTELSPANILLAVGRPDSVLDTLEQAGVTPATLTILPDHDPLTSESVFDKGMNNNRPWIVTQKDWVKLQYHPLIANQRIIIATRSATIEPTEQFTDWLMDKISKK